MNKVIKIIFPVICIFIILGTFFLLNKTQEKANGISENTNLNKNNEIETEKNKEQNEENKVDNLYATSIEDKENQKIIEQQNEERAIELASNTYGDINNVYYSNEGIENGKYIIAVRDIETTTAKIYYIVDIENEVVDIYY